MRYVIGACLVAGLVALWPLSKARTFQMFGHVVTHVDTDKAVVALTLDDGPSRKHTAKVLDILAAKDAKATFFLTGHEALQNPDLTRQIVAAGHGIGNHSFSHDRLILKSPARIRTELADTDKAIRDAGYADAIPFRPPYGQKLFVLPWVLSEQDRPSIMWDTALADESLPPEPLAAHIIAEAKPGSIIVLHVMYDSRENERAALGLIIDGLRDRGFEFVTVNALLNAGSF